MSFIILAINNDADAQLKYKWIDKIYVILFAVESRCKTVMAKLIIFAIAVVIVPINTKATMKTVI